VINIKDAESQDVRLPMDDTAWQTTASSPETNAEPTSNSRPRGPPATVTGNSMFDVLVPLMCILGQIIDMHHVAYHPRVERGASNLVAEAYTATITQQLNELAPSIALLASNVEKFAANDPVRNHEIIQHYRLVSCYAHFMLHLLYSLLGGSWDKLILVESGHEAMQTARFSETLQRSLYAADCLSDSLRINPDLGFKAMFFGIFLYHGATLPWAVANNFRQSTDPKVVRACEIYVRVFEASNCTYQAEYLRKMRKLMLLTLKEVQYGTTLSKTEQHLRKHILRVYRWSGNGSGLGL
jgi:hypothetical protein